MVACECFYLDAVQALCGGTKTLVVETAFITSVVGLRWYVKYFHLCFFPTADVINAAPTPFSGPRRKTLPALGLLKQLGHRSCPTSLMAGPDPSACIPVEVLVEQEVVAPVRIGLERLVCAENRPAAIWTAHKDVRESTRDLLGNLPESKLAARTGGTLH